MSLFDGTWPRAGCGAAIVVEGRILLVRRLRPPEAGSWSLPGGKIDPYERVEDAMRREVGEELGITLGPVSQLCVVDLIGEDHHWVSPVFLAHSYEGEPCNREPDKHAAIGWFALDTLPGPLSAAAAGAVRALPLHIRSS